MAKNANKIAEDPSEDMGNKTQEYPAKIPKIVNISSKVQKEIDQELTQHTPHKEAKESQEEAYEEKSEIGLNLSQWEKTYNLRLTPEMKKGKLVLVFKGNKENLKKLLRLEAEKIPMVMEKRQYPDQDLYFIETENIEEIEQVRLDFGQWNEKYKLDLKEKIEKEAGKERVNFVLAGPIENIARFKDENPMVPISFMKIAYPTEIHSKEQGKHDPPTPLAA